MVNEGPGLVGGPRDGGQCGAPVAVAVRDGCQIRVLEELEHFLHRRGGLVLGVGLALAQQLLHTLLQPLVLPQVDRRCDAQAVEQLLAELRLLIHDGPGLAAVAPPRE